MSEKCDFCSAPRPEWIYPVADFRAANSRIVSVGGWAACAACHDLIEQANWIALAERTVDRTATGQMLHKAFGLADAIEATRVTHEAFREHRTGPPVPSGWGNAA